MKRIFLLLIAVLATLTATSSTDPCIIGCKCHEEASIARKLKISDCQNPITLTEKSFTNNKTINVIYMENVTITKIAKDAFIGFNDLETITIKGGTIGQIEPSAFDLPELGAINFKNIKFKQTPELYSNYLEDLLFDDCELEAIPNLDNLQSLIYLNVANNRIKQLDTKTFTNLTNLEELNLSNNSIEVLPKDIFNNNSALNTLHLYNNPLKSFQLNAVSNLEYLSLKSCKLTTFDENASTNLDGLMHLDLSNNSISILPIDAFNGMDELNFIDLSNNHLVEIAAEIFEDNDKLTKILLDGNLLNELPTFQITDKFFQTNFFSCNNCGLKYLNDTVFRNMPGITNLRLANNQIAHVGKVFSEIRDLKELDLSKNLISATDLDALSKNTALEVLNLAGNPLEVLDPSAFRTNIVLKKLDVSKCNLEKLWTNHTSLPSLERLMVGGNKVKKITVEDLTVTPNIKLLDLDGNPLACSPDFYDAIMWLIKKSVFPIQGADRLKTHDSLIKDAASFDETFDQEASWKKVGATVCDDVSTLDAIDEVSGEKAPPAPVDQAELPNVSTVPTKTTSDDYYDDYDYNYDDDDAATKMKGSTPSFENDILFDESSVDNHQINIARASYILSITSVFVLTALAVLAVAVSVTLMILKRQGTLDVHNGNLPRVKIPLWHAQPCQKKHSGSVYQQLSEDLSGPRTPIINRYEFKTTTPVHNSIP